MTVGVLTAEAVKARWTRLGPPSPFGRETAHRLPWHGSSVDERAIALADQRIDTAFSILLSAVFNRHPQSRRVLVRCAAVAVGSHGDPAATDGLVAALERCDAIRAEITGEEMAYVVARIVRGACEDANAAFHAVRAVA